MDRERLKREIATELVSIMDERRFSLRELARRAGLSEMTVRRLLSGRGSPTIRTIALIADALDAQVTFSFPKRRRQK